MCRCATEQHTRTQVYQGTAYSYTVHVHTYTEINMYSTVPAVLLLNINILIYST